MLTRFHMTNPTCKLAFSCHFFTKKVISLHAGCGLRHTSSVRHFPQSLKDCQYIMQGIYLAGLILAAWQACCQVGVRAACIYTSTSACRTYVGGLPPTAVEQSIATFFSSALAAIGGNSAGPGMCLWVCYMRVYVCVFVCVRACNCAQTVLCPTVNVWLVEFLLHATDMCTSHHLQSLLVLMLPLTLEQI